MRSMALFIAGGSVVVAAALQGGSSLRAPASETPAGAAVTGSGARSGDPSAFDPVATGTATPDATTTATLTATPTAPVTPTPETFDVRGRIVDAYSASPIEGASVQTMVDPGICGSPVYSDADGYFMTGCRTMLPATLTVVVEADGYEPGRQVHELPEGSHWQQPLTFRLAPVSVRTPEPPAPVPLLLPIAMGSG